MMIAMPVDDVVKGTVLLSSGRAHSEIGGSFPSREICLERASFVSHVHAFANESQIAEFSVCLGEKE